MTLHTISYHKLLQKRGIVLL